MPYLGNYTGAPSTNPASEKTPYLRDSATPSAFGVNVDEANQQLGQQIAKTGNVVQEFGNNLQDQYNTAALADIDNQYIRATAQRTAEFNQLQGKAMLDRTMRSL
jgi:phenylalanyl-tRNA synthetase beta subunit